MCWSIQQFKTSTSNPPHILTDEDLFVQIPPPVPPSPPPHPLTTIKLVLSGHSWGMAEWPLCTVWLIKTGSTEQGGYKKQQKPYSIP